MIAVQCNKAMHRTLKEQNTKQLNTSPNKPGFLCCIGGYMLRQGYLDKDSLNFIRLWKATNAIVQQRFLGASAWHQGKHSPLIYNIFRRPQARWKLVQGRIDRP